MSNNQGTPLALAAGYHLRAQPVTPKNRDC